MGWLFFLAAVVLFFLGGVGSAAIPNPVTWGLCALALGFLIDTPFVRARVLGPTAAA